MKQADGFQLIPRFQAAPYHCTLDRQRCQQQHVIARQAEQAGARHQEHGSKKQSHEQARPRLLDAEIQEFGQEARPTAQAHTGSRI